MTAFTVLAVTLAVANVVLVALVLVSRAWTVGRARRHEERVARLRRPAVELIECDPGFSPPVLRGGEARVFAEVLARYGRRLRGGPPEQIVAYFEDHGLVDEQLRRLGRLRSWHRAGAAFALGDMGSRRAVPALVARLDDRSPDVRAAACRSLGHLGAAEAAGPIIAAGVRGAVPSPVARLALIDIGPDAVPAVLAEADHDDPRVRAAAVQLVGLLGEAHDAGAIIGRLSDPAAPVREATATALGRLGAGEATDDLVAALADRVPGVRTAAAEALGGIGGRGAVDALLPIARTDQFDPARAAAEALARAAPALVVALAEEPDAGPHLREAAGRVLL